MDNLTLLIPAKEESESLPLVLDELKKYNYKSNIILKNDDIDTINSIKNYDVKIINQNGSGYGNALIEGVNSVKTKYFCIINADGAMNPKYLYKMRKLCKNKDFIFASRYEKPGGGSDDDTLVTLIGNYFFTFFGNFLFNLKISDILYTYILGKTSSFKNLKLKNFDFRICVEIPIKAKIQNMKYLCLPSYERSRIGGIKKVNALKDGFLILTEIIKYFLRIKK